jgi:hypothetical protein
MDGTLVETQQVVPRRVVWRRPEVLDPVKDVRPHGHLTDADFHVKVVSSAVDHVGNLSRV